ncbi:hypothetical protein SARC_06879 [Sphaeroforma arctica JP610]|uniref:SAP domain-containing protein n=1 Tax=Sphaeroforma arctica JP610 TaxID=667725 RepID=A0A0L0FV93_9EUKA|nr:hypothetical protein SARC_06879 [Sphaeroforma arctica JP610]KNC80770.1 hypothetical protein SARC_06879 [Sphaeroforma arctica JP610]|eukprot:XP_014154672.1 hypothetical protein SARC_06879 [Sphaeroforma arctica JP610]
MDDTTVVNLAPDYGPPASSNTADDHVHTESAADSPTKTQKRPAIDHLDKDVASKVPRSDPASNHKSPAQSTNVGEHTPDTNISDNLNDTGMNDHDTTDPPELQDNNLEPNPFTNNVASPVAATASETQPSTGDIVGPDEIGVLRKVIESQVNGVPHSVDHDRVDTMDVRVPQVTVLAEGPQHDSNNDNVGVSADGSELDQMSNTPHSAGSDTDEESRGNILEQSIEHDNADADAEESIVDQISAEQQSVRSDTEGGCTSQQEPRSPQQESDRITEESGGAHEVHENGTESHDVDYIGPGLQLNGQVLPTTHVAHEGIVFESPGPLSAGVDPVLGSSKGTYILSAEYTQVNELGYLNSPKFFHSGSQTARQSQSAIEQLSADATKINTVGTGASMHTETGINLSGPGVGPQLLSHTPGHRNGTNINTHTHGTYEPSGAQEYVREDAQPHSGIHLHEQDSAHTHIEYGASEKPYLEPLTLTDTYTTLHTTQAPAYMHIHEPMPGPTNSFDDVNAHYYVDDNTPKSQLVDMLHGLNTVGTRDELLARVLRLQRNELEPGDLLVDYTALASKGRSAAIKVARAMGLDVEKMALSLNDIVDLLFTTHHKNLSDAHQHTLALHRNWSTAEGVSAKEYNWKWTQKYIDSTRPEKSRGQAQSTDADLWSDADLHRLPTKDIRVMLEGLNTFGSKEELVERVDRAKRDELIMDDIFVDFNLYAAQGNTDKVFSRARLMGVFAGVEDVKQLTTPEVVRMMFEHQHANITLRDHERLAEFRGWNADDDDDAKRFNKKWTEVHCLKGVKLRERRPVGKPTLHDQGPDTTGTGATTNGFAQAHATEYAHATHISDRHSGEGSNGLDSRTGLAQGSYHSSTHGGDTHMQGHRSNTMPFATANRRDGRDDRSSNTHMSDGDGLPMLSTAGLSRDSMPSRGHAHTDMSNPDGLKAHTRGMFSEPQIPLVVDPYQLGASLRTQDGESVHKLSKARIRQLLTGYNTSGNKEELVARLGRAMTNQLHPHDVFVDYTTIAHKSKTVAKAIANELGLCTVDKSGGPMTVPAIIDLLFDHQYMVMKDEDHVKLAAYRGWSAENAAGESAQQYNRRVTREYVEGTRLKTCRKESRSDIEPLAPPSPSTKFVDYTSNAYQKLSKTELCELAVKMGLDETIVGRKTKKPKTAELIDFLFKRQQELHSDAKHESIALTRGWTEAHADELSAREFNDKWVSKYVELSRMPKDSLNRLACTALPDARDLTTRQKQHALANHYALERETSLTPVNTLRELLKGLNIFGEREELVLRLDRANRNCLEVDDVFFDFCCLTSQPKAMAVEMAKVVGVSVEVRGRSLTLPQIIDALFRQQQDDTSDEHHVVLATHRGWSPETHPEQDAREFNEGVLNEHISANKVKTFARERGNPTVVDSFGFVDYTSATYTKLSKPELTELAQSKGLEVVGEDGKKLKTVEIIDLLFAAQHQELSDSCHTQIAISRGWTAESGMEAIEFNRRWTQHYVMYARMARGDFTAHFMQVLPHLENLALKPRQYALATHDALECD